MHPAFEACNMPEETDAPAGRPSLLAEGVGFEPTAPLRAYLISSQGRYDHFDNPPYGAEKSAAENQPSLKIQHFAHLVNH